MFQIFIFANPNPDDGLVLFLLSSLKMLIDKKKIQQINCKLGSLFQL